MSVGAGMGLAAKQKAELDAVVLHVELYVAMHGAMPSIMWLAERFGCDRKYAWQMRAVLYRMGGIRFVRYSAASGERVPAVVADAIAPHLDAVEMAADSEVGA